MGEWGIEVETDEIKIDAYKPQTRSIWEVMNSAITKKIKPTFEEKMKINEFMFHKLLARFENSLDFALMFTTKEVPIDKQFDIINRLVPKGFVPFEKGKSKDRENSIENIIKYYNCSDFVANQYIELMPEKEITRINEKYEKHEKHEKGKQ